MDTHDENIRTTTPHAIFEKDVVLDRGTPLSVVSEKRLPLRCVVSISGNELGKVNSNVFGESSTPVDHFFVYVKHDGFLTKHSYSRLVFRRAFLLFFWSSKSTCRKRNRARGDQPDQTTSLSLQRIRRRYQKRM